MKIKKTSKYMFNQRIRRLPKPIITVALLVSVLVIGLFGTGYVYTYNLRPVSQQTNQQLVVVAPGDSAKDIARTLKEKGLIRATWAFEWYVSRQGLLLSLQAGTYKIAPNLSLTQIVDMLAKGEITKDLVTIFPGRRLDQVKKSLIDSGFLEEDVQKALDPALYRGHLALADKPNSATLEGYLYPESFQKIGSTKPETIISASLDQMNINLTAEIRSAIAGQGLTVHEGIILASIVEKEVGDPQDRKTVAQVFLLRLRQNWALESDATTSYGAILDGKEPTARYDSPYNTYNYKGLPPGPISNVSKSSLEAVAYPSNTNYSYFVSGDPDDKGHSTTYFSHNLSDHQEFTRRYCKKLCAN